MSSRKPLMAHICGVEPLKLRRKWTRTASASLRRQHIAETKENFFHRRLLIKQ